MARAIYRERPPAKALRGGRARDLSDALAARHGVTAKTIRDVWNRGCAAAVASSRSRWQVRVAVTSRACIASLLRRALYVKFMTSH